MLSAQTQVDTLEGSHAALDLWSSATTHTHSQVSMVVVVGGCLWGGGPGPRKVGSYTSSLALPQMKIYTM
jgi:hypothetical protein